MGQDVGRSGQAPSGGRLPRPQAASAPWRPSWPGAFLALAACFVGAFWPALLRRRPSWRAPSWAAPSWPAAFLAGVAVARPPSWPRRPSWPAAFFAAAFLARHLLALLRGLASWRGAALGRFSAGALSPSWPGPTAAVACVARPTPCALAYVGRCGRSGPGGQRQLGDPAGRIQAGQDERAHLPFFSTWRALVGGGVPIARQRDVAVQHPAVGHGRRRPWRRAR